MGDVFGSSSFGDLSSICINSVDERISFAEKTSLHDEKSTTFVAGGEIKIAPKKEKQVRK